MMMVIQVLVPQLLLMTFLPWGSTFSQWKVMQNRYKKYIICWSSIVDYCMYTFFTLVSNCVISTRALWEKSQIKQTRVGIVNSQQEKKKAQKEIKRPS